MPIDRDLLIAIGLALALRKKKKRTKWTKDWLLEREQNPQPNLLVDLKLQLDVWRNYMGMDEAAYLNLLRCVTPLIKYKDTNMRKAITPHERLSATLCFLATGRTLQDMKFSAVIAASTLSSIIPETCDAIYKALHKDYLKFPTSAEEWQAIGQEFKHRWNFPNCLGAVDGKHIRIKPPSGSGSYFLNYKGYNSLVLLGVVNANYEFIMADVGTNGHVSDGSVIENTEFGRRLTSETLSLPDDATPSNSDRNLPYVFVGDEAFALRPDFLKPFPQEDLNTENRIFNYRLSRARRVVENTFGIMASRFQIFYTTINLKLSSIEKVVMACVVLHNYLRKSCPSKYSPEDCFHRDDISNKITLPGLSFDPNFVAGLQNSQETQNCSQAAKEARVRFKEYFANEGAVSWQKDFA